MARGRRAYSSTITLVALAVAGLACASADPLHPAERSPDAAALGQAGGAGGAGTGGSSDDPDAGAPLDAGDEASGTGGAAGASASSPDAGADATATPVPDAGSKAPPLVTYEAELASSFGTTTKVACASCSNGQRVALAPDSGLTFSGVVAPGAGTAALVIYYTNADSKSRSMYVGVNGGASQMLMAVFPPTGGAGTVSSISVPLGGFNAGSNNTVMLFIDTELGAPDLDRVGLLPSSVKTGTVDACNRKSWTATASVTGGDGGGPAGAIDGDLTTRWASNRPQAGTDWFQVDFGALVKLYKITLDDTKAFPNDYPGAYAVYGSLDGVRFETTPMVTGNGAVNATVINFDQRTVRAVKIAQVGTSRSGNWWQIGEVTVGCYQ